MSDRGTSLPVGLSVGLQPGSLGLVFVLGVMNLFWMVFLTALVAVEKFTRHGFFIRRGTGVFLAAWAVWLFLRS